MNHDEYQDKRVAELLGFERECREAGGTVCYLVEHFIRWWRHLIFGRYGE